MEGGITMFRKVVEVILTIILGYFTAYIGGSESDIITGSIFWILVFILFHMPERE